MFFFILSLIIQDKENKKNIKIKKECSNLSKEKKDGNI
jgi:hypothetical protein